MKELRPFVGLMRPHLNWVLLGTLLGLVTLLASIGLMTLSGWFISAAALAGMSAVTAQQFNYFTPGAGVRGFAIARTAGRYFERVTTHEATFRLLADLRSWFYRCLEPLGPARLQQFRSADLLNRLIADVNALDNLYLRVLAPSVIALLVSVLVLGFLALYSPTIALLAAVGLLLAGVITPLLAHLSARHIGERQVMATARLRQQLIALVQGLADLHIYGGVQRAIDAATAEEARLQRTQLRMSLLTGLMTALMVFIGGTTGLLTLAMGVEQVYDGRLEPAQLAMVLFCVLALFEVVAPLPLAYQYLGKTRRAAARLQEVAEAEPLINYPPTDEVQVLTPGSFSFDQVCFHYDRSAEPVLDHFSLQVSAGEKILLLGHTGSGKSTLVSLLARFHDPQQGQVLLGGHAVAHYSESTLREQMSVLSQPVQLFAGTVADNLALANAAADETAMASVLAVVRLDMELGDEPLSYSIGESGSRLSGGQRKRLALARALLRDAPILLLDEPTEGLDAATEAAVVENVLRLYPERTLVMISHHLQTAALFDRVVILDRGQVLEQGTPQALAAIPDSRFSQLNAV
ncbi:thiol reductant ABC exporter subunit CydC [Marinobacterium sp. MBR-109]|jgi:ATP-binding cassette subfamily C protein CydC|uniref:thiol reductant ABC exporter subunit CydC n=1 Tax=Marinobacterium sp. MBR-109 TaxID=3156462 RepID=UPI003396D2AE